MTEPAPKMIEATPKTEVRIQAGKRRRYRATLRLPESWAGMAPEDARAVGDAVVAALLAAEPAAEPRTGTEG